MLARELTNSKEKIMINIMINEDRGAINTILASFSSEVDAQIWAEHLEVLFWIENEKTGEVLYDPDDIAKK
jgi:hypothetical protein